MPKALVAVTLGRAMIAVGGGDEPDKWSFTGSAPSAILLNHIAITAKDKGFGVDDDGNVKQLATIYGICAKNSPCSRATTPTMAATTTRSSSHTTKTAIHR